MTTDPRQSVAEAVAFEMSAADRSKRWLSAKTGIPYSTLNRKLRAEVDFTFGELFLIAQALGVPAARFTPDAFVPQIAPASGGANLSPTTEAVAS